MALAEMRTTYLELREQLLQDPGPLLDAEEKLTGFLADAVDEELASIERLYNSASELYPYWKNYPPLDRGRQPKGDQIPWIEVGEHAVGTRLIQLFAERGVQIRDFGFPSGADLRFEIDSDTDHDLPRTWVHIDIKSVGPRDDADHTVVSHNQVSGSGEWQSPTSGVENAPLEAIGKRASHPFFPTLPPLVVFPDGRAALVLTLVAKPVYAMQPLLDDGQAVSQPLSRIDIACIPNGLLLTHNPGYLGEHPGLLYPGKDDKSKPPKQRRARIDFVLLRKIAPWRYRSLKINSSEPN